MKAREDFLPWERLQERLATLATALSVNDIGLIRLLMTELVKDYTPQNQIVDWVYLAQDAELVG